MISPFRYLYSRVRQLTPSRMTRRRLNRQIPRDITELRAGAASIETLESRKLLTQGGAIVLSGNVYVDQAKTGSFIPGEGLEGVTVTLTQVGVPNFSLTTTTQSNGSYSFPGLQNGQYIISVTQPAGYLPGTITPGTTGEVIVNDHTLQTVFLRSTTSLNYANNNFGELLYSPTINTTPNQTNVTLGSTQPTLTDTATLSGGYNESGTITFTLLKGSTVVDTEIVSVNGNGTYTTPTGYVLPAGDAAGNYQWNAVYSGDSHNNSYSDLFAANERIIVDQANPGLSTEPNIASVTLGPNSQILKDVATLSGGYNPTGTITFTLFNGTTFVDQEYVTVTGNGTYTAPGYTLPSTGAVTGTYQWNATYSGDNNNRSVTDDNNPNERTVVKAARPTISTVPHPDAVDLGSSTDTTLTDTATLSGGYNPTGTITFTLMSGNTVLDTEVVDVVPGVLSYTTPVGYVLPTTGIVAGTYQWNAIYSGDSNNESASESGNPNERVEGHAANPTLTTTPNPIQTTLGSAVPTFTDTATLSGSYFGTGTITFTLFHQGVLVDTEIVEVHGDGLYTTPGYQLPTTEIVTGDYQWNATYSGDPNNNPAYDIDNENERVYVSAASPTIRTTPTPTIVALPSADPTLMDTAILEGGYNETGSLTFVLYHGSDQVYTETVDVHGNGSYTTVNGYKLPTGETVTGTYQWQSFYSGDGNNNPASETDSVDERVEVISATPTISTVPGPATMTLGAVSSTLTDTATLSGGFNETGSITFTLYYDGQLVHTEDVAVHGNGQYTTAVGYVLPTSGVVAGLYQWNASYSGDGNNAPTSESNNVNEQVTVNQASPSIWTEPGTTDLTLGTEAVLLTDSAVLQGGYYQQGSITFTLTFDGTVIDTETVDVNGDGTYTTPIGYLLAATAAPGIYQWNASYSGDANNLTTAENDNVNEQVTVNPRLTSSLSGYVYADSNTDNSFNGADQGLANILVTLTGTDGLGNPVFQTTYTDGSGYYSFVDLITGTYTVTASAPGYLDEVANVGSQGTGTASQSLISDIQLGAGVNGTDNNFGELTGSLSGKVYLDLNDNDLFDGSDVGLEGIVVTLTASDGTTQTAVTNSDGNYTFTGLLADRYTLTEEQPTGYFGEIANTGSQGAGLADIGIIAAIDLGAGVNGTDNNFGELLPSSVAGVVFVDSNSNGTQDSGEEGIVGALITLTGTDDLGNSVERTAVTSNDGSYVISNLRPGTYTLNETQPVWYLDGQDSVGSQGGDLGNDVITNITLASNVNGTGNNFGEIAPSSLAGVVYFDLNNNGAIDGSEYGIQGVTVTLDGIDDLGNNVTLTTTTASDGSYGFENLRPGTYTLTESQPDNYLDGQDQLGNVGGTLGNDSVAGISLGSNTAGSDYNFGEIVSSRVAGVVYVDANNNAQQDVGEPGIEGATITLTGTDDLGNPVLLTTVTNSDGIFIFESLRPGTYTLSETQPGSYLDGQDALGSSPAGTVNPAVEPLGGTLNDDVISDIVLGANQNGLGGYFGELPASSLSGFVYADVNNDGVKGSTETIIGGVTVTLTGTDDRGHSVTRATISSLTDGSYSFGNLRPGTYTLTEVQPGAYLDGKDTIGTPGGMTGNDQFSQISLASGVNGTNNNFGELTGSSLAGYVYVDANNDGVKGSTEAIIGGVTITLTGTDDLGQTVSKTTTSSSVDGSYSFTNLRPGTYKLNETQPANYTDGKDTIGSQGGNATVSDVFSSIVLAAGVSGVNNNFGETVQGGSISGTKYFDVTGNGLTTDDTPLSGATIKLYLDMNGNSVLDTSADKFITSKVSGSDGTFSFNNLPVGVYFIQEAPMAGYVRTAPTLTDYYKVTVTAGSVNTGYKFDNAEICDKTTLDSSSIKYYINSSTTPVTDLRGKVNAGDTVKVVFNVVKPGEEYTLVSYTAPGASFDANTAYLQQIFDVDTLENATTGSHTLTVVVPNSFFQVDFVCCNAIDHFGPAGSNIFYSAQGRLFSADNGDTNAGVAAVSSLSGFVYVDTNNNGVKDTDETGISGVTVKLSGTDIFGNAVTSTTTTGSTGNYNFKNLNASNLSGYTITPVTPNGYLDGKDSLGSIGGTIGTNSLTTRMLNTNTNATNYNFGELLGSLSGIVYSDNNSSDRFDTGDTGLSGVTVTLTGTDVNGKSVTATTTSASDGSYNFTGLLAGTYTVVQKHVAGYTDETPDVGTSTGTASFIQGTSETISGITLTAGMVGANLNFGELPTIKCVSTSDTATIGYWQNSNGQNLIKALNGSSTSTALAKWLATTFPNLYGAGAGVYAMVSSNGTYLTNSQVAASYKTNFFSVSGQKTNAQVFAVALATYVTNTTLAGGKYASSYGFNTSSTGTGARTFNVGSDGAAFGVANNTVLTVNQLLAYTNSRATNGVLYAKDGSSATANRNLANDLYSAINVSGDIV